MLIAATFAAFFLCLSGFANAQNTYSISGTIYGDDDPLSNASLELRDSSQQVVGTTTSSDPGGTYSFSGLEPGTYKLNITPTDRPDLPAALNNELIIVDQSLANIDFYLISGGAVVLSGHVKRWVNGEGTVAEDILGLWVSLYKKNDEGNYPDLNSPTYRVDAGPEYDPDTFTQTSGGEYSVSVVPGTYLAAVEANDPIAMMIDGIPHANFSLTKMGGTYTAQGMWVPPSITDFEPEFTVTASSQAPDLYLPDYVVISGRIVDENGVGIPNVGINLQGCIENPAHIENGPNPANSTDCYDSFSWLYIQSDSEGNYQFAVPAGHDNWRIELIPPEGSGFTTTLLQRQDLSSAQSGLLLSSIPLEASPVLTGLVKRKIDGLEVVAEDILGLWVSLYKKNDEGNYPDLNSPTYRVDAGPEYDPDTFTQTSGGEYSVSVVPGTYLAAVEANDPIAMMIDGIPHANFSLTKMGGTYTAQGMWVPPSITDFEPEFTVTASSQAPDLYLPDYVVISGRIVDENGVGIPNVGINLQGCIENPAHIENGPNPANSTDCYDSFSWLYIQSDSEGNYQFAVPAGHDSWRIELIPPEGSGFTTTLLQRQDLSSAQSGLLLSSIPLEASPVLTGLVKRKIDGLEVVAEDILGLWVSLYKKNDEGNYPDLNSPTYRVDAGPEYDPDTFTQTSGGEYSVSVVPGTYLAAVEANDPIAMMIDGIPHANFSLTKMGGTYTAQGMWVPPSITDFEPEFTVTASSQAPDLYLPDYVVISGSIVDENGVGIPNVGINLQGCIENPAHIENGPNPANSTDCYDSFSWLYIQSDSEGNYQFAVPAGHDNWRIELMPPEGSGFTSATLKRVDLSAESNKVFVMGLVDAHSPSPLSLAPP